MKRTTSNQSDRTANSLGLKVESESNGLRSYAPTGRPTALCAIGHGLVAGAFGTAARDPLLYALQTRWRRDERRRLGVLGRSHQLGRRSGACAGLASGSSRALQDRASGEARIARHQRHALGLRDPRWRAVRNRCGFAEAAQNPLRAALRRGCVGKWIRRSACRQARQADPRVQPQDTRQGSQRAPGLRTHDGHHAASPVPIANEDGASTMVAYAVAGSIIRRAGGPARETGSPAQRRMHVTWTRRPRP